MSDKLSILKKGVGSSSLKAAIAADAKSQGPKVQMERECLAICIDCSGSMRGDARGAASRMHAAISASEMLIEKSRYTARIGGVAFSDLVHEEVSTLSTRHLLRANIRGFHKYDGGTVFWTAVDSARKMIMREGPTDPIRRIIFLSDGEDNGHRESLERTLNDCVDDKVIIDTVAFGDDAGRALLEYMAQKTRGVMKEASDAAELVKTFLALEAGVRGLLKG